MKFVVPKLFILQPGHWAALPLLPVMRHLTRKSPIGRTLHGGMLFINAVNEVTRERTQSIRAKEGNLNVPLFVGGKTQAQTDADTESATAGSPIALTNLEKNSENIRSTFQCTLETKL